MIKQVILIKKSLYNEGPYKRIIINFYFWYFGRSFWLRYWNSSTPPISLFRDSYKHGSNQNISFGYNIFWNAWLVFDTIKWNSLIQFENFLFFGAFTFTCWLNVGIYFIWSGNYSGVLLLPSIFQSQWRRTPFRTLLFQAPKSITPV